MAIIGINGYIGSGKDTVGEIIQDLSRVKKYDSNEIPYYKNIWQIRKFAAKLKQVASLLTGIPVEKFEDQEFKNSYLDETWDNPRYYSSYPDPHRVTVREFLQRLGTEAIRDNIHINAWVNALFADYKDSRLNKHGRFVEKLPEVGGTIELKPNPLFWPEIKPNWIITDTRFPNEAQAIKDREGVVIRIDRYSDITVSRGPKNSYTEKFDKGNPKHISLLEAERVRKHPSEISLDDWKFDWVIENNGTIEELTEKVKVMLKSLNLLP